MSEIVDQFSSLSCFDKFYEKNSINREKQNFCRSFLAETVTSLTHLAWITDHLTIWYSSNEGFCLRWASYFIFLTLNHLVECSINDILKEVRLNVLYFLHHRQWNRSWIRMARRTKQVVYVEIKVSLSLTIHYIYLYFFFIKLFKYF